MSLMLIAVAVIILWVASLYRVLSGPPCVPLKPSFLSHAGSSSKATKKRKVLLVIAHPDDESMFFAPTILFLASEGHILYILCLSTGNAEGKGNIRKEELYRACAVLEVPPVQIKILDHPKLQDGFEHQWDHQLIATIVEKEIKTWSIDSLITFDRFGVSGHRNHCDVHHGVCMLLHNNPQRSIEAWELTSSSILRKYCGPLDIWLSTCLNSYNQRRSYCLINSCPGKSYLAMAEHKSQWIWFRKLFVLLSSYTYMNTVRKIGI